MLTRGMTTVIFDEKERGDESRFFRQAEAEAIAQMKKEKERMERENSAAAVKEPPSTTAAEKAPDRTTTRKVALVPSATTSCV